MSIAVKSTVEYNAERNYWFNKFSSDFTRTTIYCDYTSGDGFENGYVELPLPGVVCDQIENISKGSPVAMYLLLLTGTATLLRKRTNQNSIGLGTTIERQDTDEEFVNTLIPLQLTIDSSWTFKETLLKVKDEFISGTENQNFQFDILLFRLGLSSKQSYPLFDITVLFENIHDRRYLSTIRTNVNFLFSRTDGKITCRVDYNEKKYNKQSIVQLVRQLRWVLEQGLSDMSLRVSEISLCRPEDLVTLNEFNQTSVPFADKTVVQLVEEQASKTPDATAIRYGTIQVSYSDLIARVDGLCEYLKQRGYGCRQLIGVMMPNSPDLICTLLAVLKSGAAYVPIDDALPDLRITYLINDSGIGLLITNGDTRISTSVATLDVTTIGNIDHYMKIDESENSMDDAAYVIYTSGTTGKSKGAVIHHRGLTNYLQWASNYYAGNERLNFPLFTSISFDLTVTSVFVPLITGSSVIIFSSATAAERVEEVVGEPKVDIVKLTPTHFKLLRANSGTRPETCRVKKLIFGGEALSNRTIKDAYDYFGKDVVIYNEYGPTETVVGSTIFCIDSASEDLEDALIGSPIANTCVYVLDEDLSSLPVGIFGEIYIGGAGVASGYVNRPVLTGEKFVPWPTGSGKVVYRTGDIGRWRPDGTLQYLGRKDSQVKIRGYRVELSEIERVIGSHPDIRQAVVTSQKDTVDTNILIAYVALKTDCTGSGLSEYIQKLLPSYMIPSQVNVVDRIPMSASGKVNSQQLFEARLLQTDEKVRPQNPTEESLLQLCSEVLGLDKSRIGTNDNFFQIGGHSLNATILIARVRKLFATTIQLGDFFRDPSIRSLAETILRSENTQFQGIPVAPVKSYYFASASQRRMYLLQQLEKDSTRYNVFQGFHVEGILRVDVLKSAVAEVIRVNEILRTSFVELAGEIYQQVHDEIDAESVVSCVTWEQETEALFMRRFVRPFDLEKTPLLRVGLFVKDPQQSILVIDMHHIITDAVSHQLFACQLTSAYSNVPLDVSELQYKDYAEWQHSRMQADVNSQHEDYWVEQFQGRMPKLELVYDFQRPAIQTYNGQQVRFTIDGKTLTDLRLLAHKEGGTTFMLLLSIYFILLQKLSDQSDIVVGVPVSGRVHSDMHDMMGNFVNTLPICAFPDDRKSFMNFFHELMDHWTAAINHQEFPLDELVEKLSIDRDPSRNPLFDTVFNYLPESNNGPSHLETLDKSLLISPVDSNLHGRTRFDLTLTCQEMESKLQCTFEYNTDLFTKETANAMVNVFRNVVQEVLVLPGRQTSTISMAPRKAKGTFIQDQGLSENIIEIFEQQVSKAPSSIAVEYEDVRLTYAELRDRSTLLASYLMRRGVKKNVVVALILDRSVEMIAAIFGILKAGGTYLPIDPVLPKGRSEFILKDSCAGLVIAHRVHAGRSAGLECIVVEDFQWNTPVEEEFSIAAERDLAYVMYTSGTTGLPKGTLICDSSVVNLARNTNQFSWRSTDRALQWSNYAFDGSVFEIFGSLLNGATLIILRPEFVASTQEIANITQRHRVSVMFVTTAVFNLLVDFELERLTGMRAIVFGGEKASDSHVEKARRVLGPGVVVNGYGPTETTVFATFFNIHAEKWAGSLPIGSSISGVTIEVRDQNSNPCPQHIAGQIFIGGKGVMRGYLNAPELTHSRSINDGGIFYATGDIGKFDGSNNLIYIGRRDSQVKVRGFRIELGEIETAITKCKGVLQAAVTVNPDNNLCAYLVAGHEISSQSVRDYLAGWLPAYMIPVFFVFLKQLPLNANGKLDRSRLPVVESRPAIPENVSDPMADRICEFYAQVLGLKKDEIAPNSDFFKLGGHSLKANILKNKLSENLQVNVPLIELFQYTTPASLSIYLKSFKDNHPAELIPVSEAKPHYTLSHSQRRMYFLHLLSADQPVYNMPFSINREDHIDTGHFQTACLELLRVHEGLRASFHIKDGQVVQQINDIDHLDVATFQCSSTEARVLSSDFSKPFDLAVAPLFRVAVFHLDDINKTLILFDVHHILLDGVSADVIVNDLSSLLRGERIEVPALQNKDYAEWQQNSVQFRQLMNKQKDFWEKYLEQSIPDLILPTDFKRGEKSSFKGDHLRLSLDAEVTAGLREIADKANCSMFVVCLGLVNVFLFKITGQKEFLVGTTVDTRNSAQLSRTIGLFVNTVVIKAALADSLTFLESIRRQKEHVLNVLDNKDYPFDELVLLKKGTRRSNRNPLFDVNFAYFKQDDVDDHERIRGLFASRKITHLDLSLFVTETTSVLNLEIEYSSALFSRSNIERQLEILQVIALQVARNENILIDNIAFTEGENESTNFATGLNTSAAFNF